jgi:hypothetical protein
MRFVEDEFLLATRVGRPDTQERLAKALAISEARRSRAEGKQRSERPQAIRPKATGVVVPFGRARRQQSRAGR